MASREDLLKLENSVLGSVKRCQEEAELTTAEVAGVLDCVKIMIILDSGPVQERFNQKETVGCTPRIVDEEPEELD